MKILKSSISLLLVLGGGIGLTSYLTSCSNSTPTPTPSPSEKPIPFTSQYFTWTTSAHELTITGLQNNVDLSNYNTLSIPATCFYNGTEYSVTKIGDNAFRNEFNLKSSIINLNLVDATNLQTIGNHAFRDCDGLTGSLVIPNSVVTIFSFAFEGCSGFASSLTIGNSVTSIGNDAFSNCAGFTGTLTISNSVTSIGDRAFSGSVGFTGSLIIPNLVTSIGDDAFMYCSGFTGSLVIPDLVTSIGYGAFAACLGFSYINVSSWTDIPTIGFDSFRDFNPSSGTVIVPSGLGITLSTFPGLPSTWSLQEV